MQEQLVITKIAVLGAGVMGAQIAAHCVNAGIETLLFDLESNTGHANAIVDKAIAHLSQLKPSPLATRESAILLRAKNYKDDLHALADCDLVIEAIAENLSWKEALYRRISPYLNSKTILVSNTSGLSIAALSHVLPAEHHHRFCGVHFFNPPRYMHLVELIPSEHSDLALLDQLETWLTCYLGKGVVRAKDTPNFIANRIGVFSLLITLHHAKTFDLGMDEVDVLTGTLLGRPKSATCRTMDVVGLDTLKHVVQTMQDRLIDDPWHAYFQLPDWLNQKIDQGHLGQKTGQGIYRKKGQAIEVYDVKLNAYRPMNARVSPEVKSIMRLDTLAETMQRLSTCDDRQAHFLMACLLDLFHYAAFHLTSIADTVRAVDLAMQWGFGWRQGPFEHWQASGFDAILTHLTHRIAAGEALSSSPLPNWLDDVTAFYQQDLAYCPSEHRFKPTSELPIYQLRRQNKADVIFENHGLKLSALPDDIFVLNFKSKANCINQAVIDGLQEALYLVERQSQGCIIYQEDINTFSAGADLKMVYELIQSNRFDALERVLSEFQQVMMRIKYSPAPVIAGLRGKALGGGCELVMHAARTVAAFESYPGLVEVGVGLIPGGGGCKEMALRAAEQAHVTSLMNFVRPYFEQIATAVVAGSATDARIRGYLKSTDPIVMHVDDVLPAAIAEIHAMQACHYRPPIAKKFAIAGREGRAQLQAGLVNWLEGGFISEHDLCIAMHIATILCGGDLDEGTLVDEQWILKREIEAFMTLAHHPMTQARIGHFLETGKGLRN